MIDTESPRAQRAAEEMTKIPASSWRVEWYGRETWTSTTLGLPGAGGDMMVPGHCIKVRYGERVLEFHTSSISDSVRFVGETVAGPRMSGHGVVDLTL